MTSGRCVAFNLYLPLLHHDLFAYQSHDEPRIVHLAVHPSAWSSAPPEVPQPVQPVFTPANLPRPVYQAAPQHVPAQTMSGASSVPTAITAQHPLAYVLFKHQNALIALMQGSVVYTDPSELDTSRLAAVQAVERHGWLWPAILDEEFPAATEGGLKYEHITVGSVVLPFPLRFSLMKIQQWPALPVPLQLRTTNSVAGARFESPYIHIHSPFHPHHVYQP